MREWWPLPEIGCQPPLATRVVARRGDASRTHADFHARLNGWQRAFETQDLPAWALHVSDPFDFAAALFGAWHAGKTVVLPGDDRPATLAALQEMGFGVAGDAPGALWALDAGDASMGADGVPSTRRALDARAARLKLFTSGSQGQPQAIDKTLAQLWAEVQVLEQTFGARMDAARTKVERMGAEEGATVWSTVSHQHIYGLLFLVLWPLAAGRPMGAAQLLYPEDMILALADGPSVLVTTPAHLKRLGGHLDWSRVKPALRTVFSSGGPLPGDVSQAAAGLLGSLPIEVFGSSETGGVAWRQATEADPAWTPFAGVQWRLDEGCLSVRSPCLPDENWWTTTDLAEPAQGGSFRLRGRQDRIVKIEEKRVSLTAVERALLGMPPVREARALLIETPIGVRVGVVVVPSAEGRTELTARGRRAFGQMLRDALAPSFDAMALPRRWRFVDALPINAQGKTTEGLLSALFAEVDAEPSAHVDLAQAARIPMTPMPNMPMSMPMPEMPAVTWLQRDEADALASLDIHAGLSVFKGHFPIAPILPGVAQLDWALTLGRQCFALPDEFVRLDALKFVSPVVPGTALLLSLQCQGKAGEPALVVLKFRLYSRKPRRADEGMEGDEAFVVTEHASGRAVWRAVSPEGPSHV